MNCRLPSILAASTCVLLFACRAFGAPVAPDALFHRDSDFDPDSHPGKALYQAHCAGCHEGAVLKAPHREFLETMTVRAVLDSLQGGIMEQQAQHLSPEQKIHIAEYLTRTPLADYHPPEPPPACPPGNHFDRSAPPAAVGWGYDPRRFVPSEIAGIDRDSISGLKLKWALAFPGATRARSQPVVAMNTIFVGSQDGTLYALDLETGCARWTANVGAEVRTAIVVEPWNRDAPLRRAPRLFFGDLLGRAYAMDALTGEVLWKRRLDPHPNATITGSPLYFDNTLYVPVSSLEVTTAANPTYPCCTFRGSLVALNPDDGKLLWRHYSVTEEPRAQGGTAAGTAIMAPSGGGVWTSPTPDPIRNLVYHGSGQNYSAPADGNSDAIFAVDMKTGKRHWHRQVTENDVWTPACILKTANCTTGGGLDFDIAASILLIDTDGGGQVLVAGQKSGRVYGIDPDGRGEILWQRQVGRGSVMGGVHFGMASEGSRVYVPVVDTPMQGDGSLAEDGAPGIHALDAATGKVLWRQVTARSHCDDPGCHPGVSSALTAIPGIVFAGHLDGMLRAYDGETGSVLWQADTQKPVMAVNGLTARGGSMSGPGPAIADGHVIVNSGYSYAMFKPGNALLVYSIDSGDSPAPTAD